MSEKCLHGEESWYCVTCHDNEVESMQKKNALLEVKVAELEATIAARERMLDQTDATCIKQAFTVAEQAATIERLRDAGRQMINLFEGKGTKFYIKKLGGPITNRDQDGIDKAFSAMDAALIHQEPKP